MYYSVTFENASGIKKNTWSDWQLIPTTPPILPPPEAEMNYVEIPGRKAGPIDLSTAISGDLSYNNLEGDWAFIATDQSLPRVQLFEELKRFLHGQQMKVTLEEDPLHYHFGRIFLSAPQSGRGPNAYSMHYILGPLRYLQDGTEDGI